MSEFADQLKRYRKKANITQDDLAGDLFVTRQAISKWESGDSTPDLNNLIKLTSILNVSLDTLVLGKEKEEKADSDEFVFDPRKNKYVRRLGKMNFWDFMANYYWIVILLAIIIGFFSVFH